MRKKLTVLYGPGVTTITEQANGSLTIVQNSNDVRDTQQVVVLSAKQWQSVLAVREFYIKEGVI